jgi:hypothetical protein
MPAIYWKLKRGRKSLPLTEVHRSSLFDIVNDDLYSGEDTKIDAQQIHVLEMRAGVRRVHVDSVAIDLNGKLVWNRIGSKQLVACLESVISEWLQVKCVGTPYTSCERNVKGLPLSYKKCMTYERDFLPGSLTTSGKSTRKCSPNIIPSTVA